MRPLYGGKGRADLKRGCMKSPRKPMAGLAAVFALTLVAAAVVVGMRAVRLPADGSLPQAPSAVVTRPSIPEKWRELQKPLPPVTQVGKEEEETISFPERADSDPFAPDSSIVRYYRMQGQRPGPASAEPGMGPDEVSKIIAAASAKNVSKAATKPGVPAEEEPSAKPEEGAKRPSSPVPELSEPVTVAPSPSTPTPALTPEELPSAEEGSVPAEPARKTGTAEPDTEDTDRPGDAAVGKSASPADDARASEVAQGSEPPQAAQEKPSAGSDAGKPGTAKTPSVADTGGEGTGPTAAGKPDAGKGSPTVKESGRESVPPEPVAPPRPRVEPPLMLVTGIICAGDSAYAIVKTPQGSSIVRPGDQVGGVTVKSVGEKSITVIKEGEEFVLELGGGSKR